MLFRAKNGELIDIVRSQFITDTNYYNTILSLKTNNNYPKGTKLCLSLKNKERICNIAN